MFIEMKTIHDFQPQRLVDFSEFQANYCSKRKYEFKEKIKIEVSEAKKGALPQRVFHVFATIFTVVWGKESLKSLKPYQLEHFTLQHTFMLEKTRNKTDLARLFPECHPRP